MLYAFENLSNKITELGYPETNEGGFRVIRKDLTQEEHAGNVTFSEDGIYLTVDGREYKGYMYLKYPNVEKFNMPKFHITNCQAILDQRAKNGFDGRYFWHNSNTVTIEDRANGQVHVGVNLALCNYCRNQSNVTDYSDTEGFFNLLDEQELQDDEEYKVDIFGYLWDWPKISREYKKSQDYTCESCGLRISVAADRRFMHAHHKNGDKLINRKSNLECLCTLCHSYKDQHHQHNFQTPRMQKDIKSFISKYRAELISLGNPFINRVI